VVKIFGAKEFFTAIKLDPATLSKDSWTLVPMEPIRQALDTKGIEALKPFSRFAARLRLRDHHARCQSWRVALLK
jgi:hypothetical protein